MLYEPHVLSRCQLCKLRYWDIPAALRWSANVPSGPKVEITWRETGTAG